MRLPAAPSPAQLLYSMPAGVGVQRADHVRLPAECREVAAKAPRPPLHPGQPTATKQVGAGRHCPCGLPGCSGSSFPPRKGQAVWQVEEATLLLLVLPGTQAPLCAGPAGDGAQDSCSGSLSEDQRKEEEEEASPPTIGQIIAQQPAQLPALPASMPLLGDGVAAVDEAAPGACPPRAVSSPNSSSKRRSGSHGPGAGGQEAVADGVTAAAVLPAALPETEAAAEPAQQQELRDGQGPGCEELGAAAPACQAQAHAVLTQPPAAIPATRPANRPAPAAQAVSTQHAPSLAVPKLPAPAAKPASPAPMLNGSKPLAAPKPTPPPKQAAAPRPAAAHKPATGLSIPSFAGILGGGGASSSAQQGPAGPSSSTASGFQLLGMPAPKPAAAAAKPTSRLNPQADGAFSLPPPQRQQPGLAVLQPTLRQAAPAAAQRQQVSRHPGTPADLALAKHLRAVAPKASGMALPRQAGGLERLLPLNRRLKLSPSLHILTLVAAGTAAACRPLPRPPSPRPASRHPPPQLPAPSRSRRRRRRRRRRLCWPTTSWPSALMAWRRRCWRGTMGGCGSRLSWRLPWLRRCRGR